jgi:hypothetical protein
MRFKAQHSLTYPKNGAQRLLKALLIADFIDKGLSADEDNGTAAHMKSVDFSCSGELIKIPQ